MMRNADVRKGRVKCGHLWTEGRVGRGFFADVFYGRPQIIALPCSGCLYKPQLARILCFHSQVLQPVQLDPSTAKTTALDLSMSQHPESTMASVVNCSKPSITISAVILTLEINVTLVHQQLHSKTG